VLEVLGTKSGLLPSTPINLEGNASLLARTESKSLVSGKLRIIGGTVFTILLVLALYVAALRLTMWWDGDADDPPPDAIKSLSR
jgi:hypothetical protein